LETAFALMPLETPSFDALDPISTATSGSACAVASEMPTATRPPWTSWIFAEAKSRASERTVAEAAPTDTVSAASTLPSRRAAVLPDAVAVGSAPAEIVIRPPPALSNRASAWLLERAVTLTVLPARMVAPARIVTSTSAAAVASMSEPMSRLTTPPP
jgi:hypothetical protein